jgi:hypothetical protein
MLQKLSLAFACLLLFSATPVMAQPVPDFCEGNFDCDVDVDGTDAFNFKADFGRSSILNPCPSLDDCPSPWAPCPDGMLICDNSCIDPQTDEAHCGGCSLPCNGTCVAGVCRQDNPLPDLVIQKMVIDPIQPAQGQTVAIEITVKNQGQAASVECWLDWYNNLSAPPISHQEGDDYVEVPILAPSESYTWQTSYVYNSVGDFNMYAQVDSFNYNTESIEDNNVYGPHGIHVANPTSLPRTGLTTSYYTGDDGDWQTGVEWPNPRFTDNLNGTITDNLTGLIWLKNANCSSFFAPTTWTAALAACNGLSAGYCGLTDGSSAGDWRLPNRNELNSLVDVRYVDPALCNTSGAGQWTSGNPFTNVQSSSYYWSSTPLPVTAPAVAWRVSIGTGEMLYSMTSEALWVWPVRGGY